MEVVDGDLRLQREQAREVREPIREGAVRREVLEVAVVRRDVGARSPRERERVLELRADGEQRDGRRDGSGSGSGAYPRARRTTLSRRATTRVTVSS